MVLFYLAVTCGILCRRVVVMWYFGLLVTSCLGCCFVRWFSGVFDCYYYLFGSVWGLCCGLVASSNIRVSGVC